MLQMLPQARSTMALTKFSAATTSSKYSGPIPWSHVISENSLFTVFEFPSSGTMSQASGSARFKIINDPEVLVIRSQRHPGFC